MLQLALNDRGKMDESFPLYGEGKKGRIYLSFLFFAVCIHKLHFLSKKVSEASSPSNFNFIITGNDSEIL